MAYGDKILNVQAEFREFRFKESCVRFRKSVEVVHVSRNRVLLLFPRKPPVFKSLTAKRISLLTREGRNLVVEWRE